MDLNEVLGHQELSKILADSCLDPENALLGCGPQIDDPVVQSGLELDCDLSFLALLFSSS